MKVLFLSLLIFTSTLAGASEVVVCNVGISHSEAEKLKFYNLTQGARLISEEFISGGSNGWNNKNFEIALEEDGRRDVAFTLNDNEPTSRAPMNISWLVDTFSNSEATELNISIDSFLNLEGKDYSSKNLSEMICFRNSDKRCIGNSGGNIYSGRPDVGFYFSYSIFCRPM